MTEKLLHYIWLMKRFDFINLQTTDGQPIEIMHAGIYNNDAGPDFLDARIKVGDTVWAGNIEMHIQSGDWLKHGHSSDAKYRNVILHVVWKDDRKTDLPFPTLELQHRVPKLLLNRYKSLMGNHQFIPCESLVNKVPDIIIHSMQERMIAERMKEKERRILDYLSNNRQSWEETFWWMLARNFGLPVNATEFESIAKTLPVTLLAKCKHQFHQIEALLLGQAGLLEGNYKEEYPAMLQKEYRYLKKKFQLKDPLCQVNFLRMRPANFPTIRLAQLAKLVFNSNHLFSKVKEAVLLEEIDKMLDVSANDYWNYHYMFDEETIFKEKRLGKQMRANLIINTIIPVLYAYGKYNDIVGLQEKAIRWLEQASPEANKITKGFSALGFENNSAYQSQSLIHLYKCYCSEKHCLHCAIGNSILKRGSNLND